MLELVAIDRTARTRIRDVWAQLEAAARPSYFLSWGWVETWLDMVPQTVPLTLYVARRGGEPFAACFLGAHTMWRHRVLPSRSLHLNQTGRDNYDEICIEYNGFLTAGAPPLVEIIERLPVAWDELYLPALDEATAAVLPALERRNLRVRVERDVISPFVDLDLVRKANGDYASILGKNTRASVRKSIRLYEARGKLVVEVAETLDQALDIFRELVELHRRGWQARGQAGAFIPFVHAFHDRLIRNRFASGEIQLLRARAGDTTIGCLYNFVYGGDIAFYQCGFAYEDDSKLKPGLVCHYEAVRFNATREHRRYDFLAGDRTYKQQLATDRRTLVWARVQKPRLRFFLEDFAKTVRDEARSRFGKPIAKTEPPATDT